MKIGHCLCGCGRVTPIAKRNDLRRGIVKGQPLFYVRGHGSRHRVDPEALYRVDNATGCWIWIGAINPSGYGIFGRQMAHRWAWEREHGRIPRGGVIDHTCHTDECPRGVRCQHRRCVNPDHLELVSLRVNTLRGHSTRLTPEIARVIRESSAPRKELAARYGVSIGAISDIRGRRTWRET